MHLSRRNRPLTKKKIAKAVNQMNATTPSVTLIDSDYNRQIIQWRSSTRINVPRHWDAQKWHLQRLSHMSSTNDDNQIIRRRLSLNSNPAASFGNSQTTMVFAKPPSPSHLETATSIYDDSQIIIVLRRTAIFPALVYQLRQQFILKKATTLPILHC